MLWPFSTSFGNGFALFELPVFVFGFIHAGPDVFLHLSIRLVIQSIEFVTESELRPISSVFLMVVTPRSNCLVLLIPPKSFLLTDEGSLFSVLSDDLNALRLLDSRVVSSRPWDLIFVN